MLDKLYKKIDIFFDKAHDSQPDALICTAGCFHCCEVDLSVFSVEAQNIQKAFSQLPNDTKEQIQERAHNNQFCIMLDPQTKLCQIYHDRPLICRSHGLAMIVEKEMKHCHLTYQQQKPRKENILDIERINEPLAVIDQMNGGNGKRIRLADLVLNNTSKNIIQQ